MEKYFKNIEGDYLVAISTSTGNEEITKEEYENILSIIRSCPIPEPGSMYKLRADLSWELCDAPPVDEDTDAMIEDYLAALAELGVIV